MQSAYLDPYIEVDPRGPAPIEGLEKTVIYFFSPDCSSSRKLHDNIVHWGARCLTTGVLCPWRLPDPGTLPRRSSASQAASRL